MKAVLALLISGLAGAQIVEINGTGSPAQQRPTLNANFAFLDAKHLKGSTAPTGSCAAGAIYIRTGVSVPGTTLYVCPSGAWEGPYALITVTPLSAALNLSDLPSAATARVNLGLGSAALLSTSAVLQSANNLSDLPSVSTARTNLGLGTAAIMSAGAFLQAGSNLSELSNMATARSNLGLGSAATQPASAFEAALSAGTTSQYYRGDKTWQTLNTSAVPEGSNQYFTAARVFAALGGVTNRGIPMADGSAYGLKILPASCNGTSYKLTWDGTDFLCETDQAGAGGGGITSLGGLTASTQTFATGSTGTDFNIVSGTSTHTFHFPSASASNRGLLTSSDWSLFNGKEVVLSFASPLSRSSNTISLANTAVTPGSYQRASVTIDAQGRVTAASSGPDTVAALAANGTNCAAGNYPLGVDAAGVVEGCTAALAIGTSGTTAAAGNDSRLSDPRTPIDGSVTTVKIANGNVTLDKIESIPTARFVGNNSGSSGPPLAMTGAQVKTALAYTYADLGTAPIGNGGTGQTTAQAARNALMPAQSGNAGKYAKSDGTDITWQPGALDIVTIATLPSSPVVNQQVIVTDLKAQDALCSGGGGNVTGVCYWTGFSWVNVTANTNNQRAFVTDSQVVAARTLVELDTATNSVKTAASGSSSGIGVAIQDTIGTGTQALGVVVSGFANAVADNAVTKGRLIIAGTTTAGRLRDSGQTSLGAISPTVRVYGRAVTDAASAGNTFEVQLFDGLTFGTNNLGNAITSLTGDVTGTGPGATAATIAANAVTNAKAAQMPTMTIKGNDTGGTANAKDLTVSEVRTQLGLSTVATSGSAADLSGTLALARLPAALKVRTCQIVIGDDAGDALADTKDAVGQCLNDSGSAMTILAVQCWADAGTPTILPILHGGGSTSILTGAMTCGTGKGNFAGGTVNGSPSHAINGTIDFNIATAGGTAKEIYIAITRTL